MTIYHEKIDFINRVFKPSVNIVKELPLLLNKSNDENILYLKEDKTASVVSILYRDFTFGDIVVKSSFIGLICTDDEALSSKLLDKALEEMDDRGVCLSLAAGYERLYQRKGFIKVNNSAPYIIKNKEDLNMKAYKVTIREILKDKRLFDYFIKAYHRENNRFVLSNEDIEVLLQSFSSRGYIIYMFNKIEPEFIILKEKDGEGFIKDILGVKEDLDKKLGYIKREFNELKMFMPGMVKIIDLKYLVECLNRKGYHINLLNDKKVEIKGTVMSKDQFTRYLFKEDGKFLFMNYQ